MRVLMIEDDPFTTEVIRIFLRNDESVCDFTESGEDGFDIAKRGDYDVIILDVGLPDIDGREVLMRLRDAKVKTPVLMLSGQTELKVKLECFERGAADYVEKPFEPKELLARLRAISRRFRGHASPIVEIGELTVNLGNKEVVIGAVSVHVTTRESQLLQCLALFRGSIVKKERLYEYLYEEPDDAPFPKIIDVYLCRLRNKFWQASGRRQQYIQTVWGVGYRLAPDA